MSAAEQRKARLSRELVLTAALDLVDSEGLDALTMRRLAQELQCDPMSIYRHAADRAALLDGVTELVVNELAPIPETSERQAQLRRLAHDVRLPALRHPNLVPLLVTRPLSTPLGNELQEFIVDPEENEAILRLGLHRLPAKDFPHLRPLAPVLADYDGITELDQGLTILLTGLAAKLTYAPNVPLSDAPR